MQPYHATVSNNADLLEKSHSGGVLGFFTGSVQCRGFSDPIDGSPRPRLPTL